VQGRAWHEEIPQASSASLSPSPPQAVHTGQSYIWCLKNVVCTLIERVTTVARELWLRKVCECMWVVTPCVVQEERASKVTTEATKVTSEEEPPTKVATGALIEETEAPKAPEAPTKVSGEAKAGKQSCDAGKVTKAAHTTTKVNETKVAAAEIGVSIEAQRSRNTANVVETKVAAAEIGVSMKTVEPPAEVAKTAGAQQAARV
jgi:hypothetical protein